MAYPENIPQILKDAPHWCCYKLEADPDGGKPRKIPYNPITRHKAKVNDPDTFCSFESAIAGLGAGYDGLNYAFGYDDLIGVDIDKCRDPDTGQLTHEAQVIVAAFAGTYQEISPSGTGLRIVTHGTLPHFGKGRGEFHHFEIYGRGPKGLHFLSITGNTLHNEVLRGNTLKTCQTGLDWFFRQYIQQHQRPPEPQPKWEQSPELTDAEVLEKCRRSKRGPEFSKLFDDGSLTGDHSTDDLTLCSIVAFYTQDPDQIDGLLRASKLYRTKWERPDYREATISKALAGLMSAWQPRGTAEEAETAQPGQTYGVTEKEAARRFLESPAAAKFRTLRQSRAARVMRYRAGIWVEDYHQHSLMKEVGALAKVILAEMAEEPAPARRDALYGLTKKLETQRGLRDITTFVVQGLPEFKPEKSDSYNDLLCVRNGVINLGGGGEILPHSPAHQFTRKADIAFDAQAACPMWLKFMDDFCVGDQELVKFLQVWFGYCLTGYTSEHKALVLFGGGSNGKSVLLAVISHVLGAFAAVTPADTLLQRKSEQSNDIAALDGIRLAVATETEEGQALAEGRLKAITGGDRVVCRELYENFKTFTPKFKLVLATNCKPRVSGTDNGIWRRLLLVPCRANVMNPDKNLTEKLKAESSGILNWAVEGCRIWKRDGLVIPSAVAAATEEYRTENDTIGRFLDEICNPYTGGLKAREIYQAYQKWATEEGMHPLSNPKFGQKMADKGFPSKRDKTGNTYPPTLSRPRPQKT